MLKKLCALLVCFALILPVDAFAGKGGGFSSSPSRSSSTSSSRSSSSGFSSSPRSSGSGFSSKPSSSSSSYSKPSMPSSPRSSGSGFSSKPSSPPISKPSPAASSSPTRGSPSGFSSKPSTPAPIATAKPKQTSVDSKVAKSNAISGGGTKTKAQAVADFKEKHASTYTNSFKTEPTTRPSYIPTTYASGGHTYNISYNAGYGGYGYYGPSGAWIMYDAMRDAAMMSVLMNNHGYVYDTPVYGGGPVVVHHGGGFTGLVIFILFLGAVLVFIFVMTRRI